MLSADFLNLGKDVAMVNANADLFHLDIMDGVFVPNISYGFPVVEAIAKEATKPLDVHLMIVQPEKYVARFAGAGASMISFHAEAADDPSAVLRQIRSLGAKAGLPYFMGERRIPGSLTGDAAPSGLLGSSILYYTRQEDHPRGGRQGCHGT